MEVKVWIICVFQLWRIQWDYDATQLDDNGVDTPIRWRRARLYAKGHGDWAYKTQFNVAESDGATAVLLKTCTFVMDLAQLQP